MFKNITSVLFNFISSKKKEVKDNSICIEIKSGRFFGNPSVETDYDGNKVKWSLGEPLHPDICDENKKQYSISTDCAKLPIWHAWACCDNKPYQYHGIYDRNKKLLYDIIKCDK